MRLDALNSPPFKFLSFFYAVLLQVLFDVLDGSSRNNNSSSSSKKGGGARGRKPFPQSSQADVPALKSQPGIDGASVTALLSSLSPDVGQTT